MFSIEYTSNDLIISMILIKEGMASRVWTRSIHLRIDVKKQVGARKRRGSSRSGC